MAKIVNQIRNGHDIFTGRTLFGSDAGLKL